MSLLDNMLTHAKQEFYEGNTLDFIFEYVGSLEYYKTNRREERKTHSSSVHPVLVWSADACLTVLNGPTNTWNHPRRRKSFGETFRWLLCRATTGSA